MTRSLPRRMSSGLYGGVHDGEVAGQELAVRAADAEVALVALGHLEDHALGQLEELVVVAAGDDVRLLDEREVLVHEEVVLDEGAAGRLRRGRRGARA